MAPNINRTIFAKMITGSAIVICAAIFVLSTLFDDQLSAQSPLPSFRLQADTTIAVSIALTDGQTILVPINLTFITRNEPEGIYLSLEADTKPQPGMLVTVAKSNEFSASAQALVYATPLPTMLPIPSPTAIAPVATNAPIPTATPLPPISSLTETPSPMPDTDTRILQSQGLGMKYDDWLAVHGQPLDDTSFIRMFEDAVASYGVIPYNGRIAHVSKGWSLPNSPSFETARIEAQMLMPRDSVLQSNYFSGSGSLVEVYLSQQLANAYPDGLYDEIVGEFIVIYNQMDDGRVAAIIVATGNNP